MEWQKLHAPEGGVLIFGGTTEGREIYRCLLDAGIPATLSVATEYGREMVDAEDGSILVGRLAEKDMEPLVASHGLVVDATHPHARAVSLAVREACRSRGRECLRAVRQRERADESHVLRFDSIPLAVEFLESQEGNILVTTGTKELSAYTRLKDFGLRVYARVLPTEDSVGLCRGAGLSGRHVIGMQGPFSPEMNRATLEEFQCRWLVTKDTGVSGGFYEKLEGARLAGAIAVVVNGPSEEGLSAGEIIELVLARFSGGLAVKDSERNG